MMKRFITLLIAAIAVCATHNMQAQNNAGNSNAPSREQYARTQAETIATDLKLEEPTRNKFIDTYIRCQQEVWNCCPPRNPKADAIDSMTEAEAKAFLTKKMAHRNRLCELQNKYYEEYSSFLTQKQIMKIYQHDRKLMERMMKRRK